MSLSFMPAEILQQIFDYTAHLDIGRGATREFRSLNLSCRYLYRLVLPYLYQDLHLSRCSAFLIFRTAVEKPEIAALIKRVVIDFSQADREFTPIIGQAYTLLRRPGLLPKVCTRHLHPNDHWTISVLIVETLLLKLCNVEELTIDMGSMEENLVLFDKKRWKPSSEAFLAQLLPSLKELSLVSSIRRREGRMYPDNERNDIFRALQLITLSKTPSLLIELDYPMSNPPLDQALLSLKKLDISCEGTSFRVFQWFLRSCPNLRSLTYYGGSGPDETHHLAGDEVSVWDIVNALDSHQEVLESLEINFCRSDEEEVFSLDTIPDMHQFSRLTNLKVDSDSLFKLEDLDVTSWDEATEVEFVHKLPKALENLTIFRADERHLDELKDLARRKSQEFPKLKFLMLELWSGETTKPLMYLDIDLLVAGVKLEWSWESPSGHYYQPFPLRHLDPYESPRLVRR